MRYTSVIIVGFIILALGIKVEYNSEPDDRDTVHLVFPQTSNMLDKRNRECFWR